MKKRRITHIDDDGVRHVEYTTQKDQQVELINQLIKGKISVTKEYGLQRTLPSFYNDYLIKGIMEAYDISQEEVDAYDPEDYKL
jgi:hypothetical protein